MKFERYYTKNPPTYEWKQADSVITDSEGKIIFSQKDITVPAHWSQTAINILAQKYFRRMGVPKGEKFYCEEAGVLQWLQPVQEGKETQRETNAWSVFHRLAGCWTYWGWKGGYFDTEEDAKIFYDEICYMLFYQIAAPNSPQWFNTGLNWAYGITDYAEGYWRVGGTDEITPQDTTPVEIKERYKNPQPHACFIQPVADNLTDEGGIFDLLTKEAKLFKQGSGTGTNFSTLRAKGEKLAGGGTSSGLMSFLRIFDRAADSVKSGGVTRRAAKMVCLDLDHPEIEDFINWKVKEERKGRALSLGSQHLYNFDQGEIYSLAYEGEVVNTISGQNSNNSVRVTDGFFTAVDSGGPWPLKERTTWNKTKVVQAKDLWHQICAAAWACADPGVQFHDTMNKWNTCKDDGVIRATNPCSEYCFLDNTACNLASINLNKFTFDDVDSITAFTHAVRLWTVVLDISITMASYPSKEIALGSYNYRTLGLGYANLAHLLFVKHLPYDSDEGRRLASSITSLMHTEALRTSAEMGNDPKLGPFPRWKHNENFMENVIREHHQLAARRDTLFFNVPIYNAKYRNAQVTLIAPTGTISLLMDCQTTGIEPYFAPQVTKNLAGGGEFEFINAVPVSECAIGEGCLSPEAHVKMVAAVQPFLSGGVSKTVNLPNSATVEDVDKIYRLAHKLGLKSISIYRDGSKLTQPLEVKEGKETKEGSAKFQHVEYGTDEQWGEAINKLPADVKSSRRGDRKALLPRRSGYTLKFRINGQTAYLRTGEYPDGTLGEIFVNLAKEGSTARALMDAFSKAISIGLQYGVPLDEFIDAFKGARFEPSGFVHGHSTIRQASSLIDLIFRELEISYVEALNTTATKDNLNQAAMAWIKDPFWEKERISEKAETPPTIISQSGEFCGSCGHQLIRAGTCLTCPNCGANTGCG